MKSCVLATKRDLADLQKQCKVLYANINVGKVLKSGWIVNAKDVTDITVPRVDLKHVESHMSDTILVCNCSCLFICIKAAKKFTTACLFSWDCEVNCPSVMQR